MRFSSDKLIKARWPKGEIIWTSVTCDIQVVRSGETWGYGVAYRVVEGDHFSSSLFTKEEALHNAYGRELSAEAQARRCSTDELAGLALQRFNQRQQ